MNINLEEITSPKRLAGRQSGRGTWYPFYPGFSDTFTASVLSAIGNPKALRVLDPWNGGGTTTSAAAAAGLEACGVDLNPVMVVVARARLLDPMDAPSLLPLARQVVRSASSCHGRVGIDEPLSFLFWPQGAASLRAIERAIRKILVESDDGGEEVERDYVERLSPLACFFYVALFRTAKRLLACQVGSNPVWTKMRISLNERARPTALKVREVFLEECESMCLSEPNGRPLLRVLSPEIRVKLGSSTSLPIDSESIDLTLTSPPYCTRIDYAVATLPELLILGYERGSSFDALRRRLLGTTTVDPRCGVVEAVWGPTCLKFLDAVENHRSKASSTYYFKNHVRYFSELHASMKELRRVTASSGIVVLVVQDSYYKDVHNDLARIIVEMAESVGFSIEGSRHFPIRQLLAGANPRVRKYRAGGVSAVESVVVVSARSKRPSA